MIVLGLDPGTATTGYGIVQTIGHRIEGVCYGTIDTTPDLPMQRRLNQIYNELNDIFRRYAPQAVAVEKLYFGRNVTTAITVGQARGVLLLQAEQHGIKVGEYTPMQVKKALVGYGNAEKKQVQYMVQRFLRLDHTPKPDDAADALAIAICHAHTFLGRGF